MRDGKWYRKDYYAAEVEGPKVCQMCPVHLERIAILTRELEQLKILIAERERLIAELRARLQKWEIDSREWLSIRQQLYLPSLLFVLLLFVLSASVDIMALHHHHLLGRGELASWSFCCRRGRC